MDKKRKQKLLALALAATMVTGIGTATVTLGNISSLSVSAAETKTTSDGFSYEEIDGSSVRITGNSQARPVSSTEGGILADNRR